MTSTADGTAKPEHAPEHARERAPTSRPATPRAPARFTEVTLRHPPAARAAPGVRLPALHEVEGDALATLAALSVVIVGCGSVGGRIALHCARMGVGRLLLVDPDRYGPESLATHDVCPQDVGAGKAARTAARAKAVAPDARVSVYDGPVEELDALMLLDADALVVATDNVPAELASAQLALRLGVPLLHAALHGETLTAQVRVTGVAEMRQDQACLACLMGPAELDEAAQRTRYACAGPGAGPGAGQGAGMRAGGGAGGASSDVVGGTPVRADAPPTMSVSALCGLAADLATLELLRAVLGLGPRAGSGPGAGAGDVIVEQNIYARRTTVSPARRRVGCPLEHCAFERRVAPDALERLSVRELAAAAGLDTADPALSLAVEGRQWVSRAVCNCGAERPVDRLCEPGASAGRCARCRERLHVPAVYRHRRLSGPALLRRLDRPLARLGAGRPSAVLLEADGRPVALSAPARGATSPQAAPEHAP
jgi:molybdopterin/thiamine biosynthesis adenylyltransferase